MILVNHIICEILDAKYAEKIFHMTHTDFGFPDSVDIHKFHFSSLSRRNMNVNYVKNLFCMISNTYTFRAILFFYLKECFVSSRFHNIFILCMWKCYRKNHIWSFTNLLSAKTYKLIHTFDSQMSQTLWLPILRLQMFPKREHICS